jgi:proton glutamate symport protein
MKFLLTLKALLLGIGLGIILGLFFPAFSQEFSVLGVVYISLLKMCALPILITAVVTSFASALKEKEVTSLALRAFAYFAVFMCLAALVGILVGEITSPFLMENAEVKAALSKLVVNEDLNSVSSSTDKSLKNIFLSLIPDNVFRVLAEGQLLPLLFFMVLFGISLGLEKSHYSERVLEVLEGIRQGIFRIMNWFFYLLPFSLASMLAKSISSSGQETLQALFWLLMGGILLIVSYTLLQFVLLCLNTRRNPWRLARELREALLVAFGTSSSLAALPSSIKVVTEKLSKDSVGSNLVLALGISFNGQATVLFHAWITILIGQLYGAAFGIREYMIIVFGCILRAVISAGVPASVSLLGISLIFDPLGLPIETVLALLTVLIPFLDPFLTVNNVAGNIMAASYVAETKKH